MFLLSLQMKNLKQQYPNVFEGFSLNPDKSPQFNELSCNIDESKAKSLS